MSYNIVSSYNLLKPLQEHTSENNFLNSWNFSMLGVVALNTNYSFTLNESLTSCGGVTRDDCGNFVCVM